MTGEEWVGKTIGGKYRVEAVLGKGGMGVVLRARHLKLDEPVAIKVLLASMMEVPGMVTRFVREARAASKIKSPHVVRVTDVDTLEDGVPYMVMEYLEGTDLAAHRRKHGPFEVPEATRFILEACDAVAEAHSLGIVHRDLKPANLFLAHGRDGTTTLKVLDFGISKLDAPSEEDTTKTGQMMGSPKYMSPEQMLSMHDVDGRSDIWSLGAILYELLTGRPPFIAESAPRVCALVLNEKPEPPITHRPDLPLDLNSVVLRCLEKDPNQRFACVAEFVTAFAHFAAPETSGRITIAGPRFSIIPAAPQHNPEDATRPEAPESSSPVPVTLRGGGSSSKGDAAGASRRRMLFAGMGIVALLAIGIGGFAVRHPAVASPSPVGTADAVASTIKSLQAAASADAGATETASPAPSVSATSGAADSSKAAADKTRTPPRVPRGTAKPPTKAVVEPSNNGSTGPATAGNLFPGRQ